MTKQRTRAHARTHAHGTRHRYFQLYKSNDGVTVDAPLAATEQVWQAQRGTSKLIYMLQIFMNSLDTTDDPKLINLVYNQAVYNFISGNYVCSEQTLVTLAAQQCQVTFGNFREAVHKVGFLSARLIEFLPMELIAKRRPAEWEEQIYQVYRELPRDISSSNAKRAYITESERWPAYVQERIPCH